ncbi:hypothetical protein BJ165DRAFT_702990 [Panaeolus papilionaceus]|nr:hypothetical protein BJ165DRAFT_702990 [Panaeolus papilionaceus]
MSMFHHDPSFSLSLLLIVRQVEALYKVPWRVIEGRRPEMIQRYHPVIWGPLEDVYIWLRRRPKSAVIAQSAGVCVRGCKLSLTDL